MKSLPQPTRKNDIIKKLEYAEKQRNDLINALYGSYETDELPRFISMQAESVLSNTRECFDYLAHELIEGYLLPQATPKFVASYKNGKEKTYFPFYLGQLTQHRLPWHQFKTVDEILFYRIKGFIDAIEQSQRLGYTSFNAQDFRVVQQMVNEKKHSKVTQYHTVSEAAFFYKGQAGSIVLDKATANMQGLKVGTDFGGNSPKSVPIFRFSANGRDVPDLCLFAVSATRTVLDWFYETFFASTEQRINDIGPMMVNGIAVDRPMWVYELR